MKKYIPILGLMVFSANPGQACDQISRIRAARKYLQDRSPTQSKINLKSRGQDLHYAISLMDDGYSYRENGTLSVAVDKAGKCLVSIQSSQIQSQSQAQ